MSGAEWYSDAALAKQEALRNRDASDGASWGDIAGILEPRVHATEDERCHNCGLDARDGAGGDGHFCELHIGRDYEAPDDCPDECRRARLTP